MQHTYTNCQVAALLTICAQQYQAEIARLRKEILFLQIEARSRARSVVKPALVMPPEYGGGG